MNKINPNTPTTINYQVQQAIEQMVSTLPKGTDLGLGTPVLDLTAESLLAIYPERWPIEGISQTGKYLLSGGGGRHYVHHPTAIKRLPALTMIFGSLLKYLAAISPPFALASGIALSNRRMGGC